MIFFKYVKIVLPPLVFVMLISCGDQVLPPGHRGEPFKLADSALQEKVIARMKKEGIPYVRDDSDFVHYLLKNQAEVKSIIRFAKYGDELIQSIVESKIIIDQNMVRKYSEAFENRGIPYNVVRDRTHYLIEWSQIHGPQVDTLIEGVDREVMDSIVKSTNP